MFSQAIKYFEISAAKFKLFFWQLKNKFKHSPFDFMLRMFRMGCDSNMMYIFRPRVLLARIAFSAVTVWPLFAYCANSPIPQLSLAWPVAGAIGQDFNAFEDYKANKYHAGTDFPGSHGVTPVLAAGDGTIVAVTSIYQCTSSSDVWCDNHGMGRMVIIQHQPSGRYTLYAHLDSTLASLRVGNPIYKGNQIGVMGCSGFDELSRTPLLCTPSNRSRTHLHFEVKATAVWNNPTFDSINCGATGSECWGYTPVKPTTLGYFDPALNVGVVGEVTPITDQFATITAAGSGAPIRVRPEATASVSAATAKAEAIKYAVTNDKYYVVAARVATAGCAQGWYQIQKSLGTCDQNKAANCLLDVRGGHTTSYSPDGWICRGVNAGDASWITLDAPVVTTNPLTIGITGTGAGRVLSSPSTATSTGINCSTGPCTALYNSGASVTLNATPATGSSFAGWSGGGCSGTGSCTVTMNAAQSVSASFTLNATQLPNLTVTAMTASSSAQSGGAVSVSATVTNQGSAAAGASRLKFYLSSDNIITTADTDTTSGCNIPPLAAGAPNTCSGSVLVPSVATGIYYFGAIADVLGAVTESNENNNSLAASSPTQITGTAATLPTCTLTASPSSISAGGSSVLTASCSPAATSYIWRDDNLFRLPYLPCTGANMSKCTFTPTHTTTYTVAGTNASGTGAVASATVTVTPTTSTLPNCNLTQIKFAGKVVLDANCDAAKYVWVGTAFSEQTKSGFIDPPSVTTTYSVTGYNSAGAAGNTSSLTITVANSCTVTASPPSIGLGESSTLIARCSPAATGYDWNGACAATNTSDTCIVTPVAMGAPTYTVTGTGGNTATSSSVTVTVAALPKPICTLTASPSTITAVVTSTLTASCSPAATSYTWTGVTCAGVTTSTCTVNPSVTTNYTVAGTNASGTGATASVSVNVSMAAAYTDNGDGTVTDTATGLMWQRCSMGQTWDGSTCTGTASTYTWDQANTLTSTFANQSDWRLPNIRELQTIVDWSRYNPAIDTTAFPNTPSTLFWSGSLDANYSSYAWFVGFSSGHTRYASLGNLSVRLVRGGQSLAILSDARPDADYTDNGDGTVTHTPTGLMWKQCSEGQAGSTCTRVETLHDWDEANALTANFAGHSDWRLPTEDELLSLVDYTKSFRAINTTLFPNTPRSCFWSGSPYANNSYYVWSVEFSNGYADRLSRTSPCFVRLVRGGQSFDTLPVCTLSATPALISAGDIVILTASCSPAATSYTWTGGTCLGITAASCKVDPFATTTYSVAGVNSVGTGAAASATVMVAPPSNPTCPLTASPTLISPASSYLSSASSTGDITVTASSGCTWTATSNASWLTITSGSSGNGNGSVVYSVATNTDTAARTGTITIAGQTFTVTQNGASVALTGKRNEYQITRNGGSYAVADLVTGRDGTKEVASVDHLVFSDVTVNLTVQAKADSIPPADLQQLQELYVAFFNRVPNADGLAYWIDQFNAGMSISQIAESFYAAGVQNSSTTGYSPTMSDSDFIHVIYRNVLGRPEGAAADGLAYWSGELASGRATRGTLVTSILNSAHILQSDPTYGWVADLLDNKITVAHQFSVTLGLSYKTADDSITNGMAIASAVTPTSTAAATALIGVGQ